MEVELIDIEKVILDPQNAREHSRKNIDEIKASLKKFGQVTPIVLQRDRVCPAGNGRVMAARELGWKQINIVWTDLKGDEARAYALADNQVALSASWKPDILSEQLNLLKNSFNMPSFGFDLSLLKDAEPPNTNNPDECPDIDSVPLRVSLGEIWQLGEHRLMCGDSTDGLHVTELLNGEVPILMSTDPPYGVKLDQSWRDKAWGKKARGAGNKNVIQNDDQTDWTETYKLFPGNIVYVWHDSSKTDIVKNNIIDSGFDVRQMIIWNKSVMVMGRSSYHFKHEPCWYGVRKNKDANWLGDRSQTTVWDAASPNHIMSGSKDDKTEHPSQKPIVLSEIPINNHTKIGDGVYDPFGGSGSTLIACEKLKRKCFMMELDPKYSSLILDRWEKYSNKKAVQIGTS